MNVRSWATPVSCSISPPPTTAAASAISCAALRGRSSGFLATPRGRVWRPRLRTGSAHGASRVAPPLALQHAAQVAALHVSHGQVEQPVRLARRVDGDDARMLEAARDPALAEEPRTESLVPRE